MALLAYGQIGFLAEAIGGADSALIRAVVAASLASLPNLDMQMPLVNHRGAPHRAWSATLIGGCIGAMEIAAGLQMG